MKPVFFLLFLASFALLIPANQDSPSVSIYSYRVVHVYPHDTNAFTQGLEYQGGSLFEGTGLNGQSSLRREELETGRVLQEIRVPERFFGEGITVLGDRIMELTWQAHTGFVYGRAQFNLLKTFAYPGEGWGLTNDGRHLYMSDGTAQIRVWDPETLREQRRITVHSGGKQYQSLNELEWVRDEIYANVWQTDEILRIDPRDGAVTGIANLGGLLSQVEREAGADVLNGIAYDARSERLFVTGKLWPKLFEIKLVPRS